MTRESLMKLYKRVSLNFHIQRVINITLLMLDTQILKGILLHTKVRVFVIIYRIFNVDKLVLCVHLADQRKHLTITTHRCEISLNELFGVWKARWALLRDMHVNYTYNHQVSIMLASMATHNFIRKAGRFDEAFNTAQQESYNPIEEDGASIEDYEEVPATNRTDDGVMHMLTFLALSTVPERRPPDECISFS